VAWLYIFVAGLFEVSWAIGLKYTEGFSKFWLSIGIASALIVSLFLLSVALKTLPIGTAYTVCTGIGAAGTAVVGIILFGESREFLRLLCILLIVAGIAGLRLMSTQ